MEEGRPPYEVKIKPRYNKGEGLTLACDGTWRMTLMAMLGHSGEDRPSGIPILIHVGLQSQHLELGMEGSWSLCNFHQKVCELLHHLRFLAILSTEAAPR